MSGGIGIAEGFVDALEGFVAIPGTDGYGHHRVFSSESAPSVDVQLDMLLNVVAVAAVHRHEVKDDDVSSQTRKSYHPAIVRDGIIDAGAVHRGDFEVRHQLDVFGHSVCRGR